MENVINALRKILTLLMGMIDHLLRKQQSDKKMRRKHMNFHFTHQYYEASAITIFEAIKASGVSALLPTPNCIVPDYDPIRELGDGAAMLFEVTLTAALPYRLIEFKKLLNQIIFYKVNHGESPFVVWAGDPIPAILQVYFEDEKLKIVAVLCTSPMQYNEAITHV